MRERVLRGRDHQIVRREQMQKALRDAPFVRGGPPIQLADREIAEGFLGVPSDVFQSASNFSE